MIGIGMVLVAALAFAMGWATRDDPTKKPAIIIAGGGFIYNYRVAEVFYGFTAMVVRPVSNGSLLVAEFEDPGGGPPLVVEKRVTARTSRYGMRSPPVHGVVAHQPYHVSITLYDRTRTEVLFSAEKSYAARMSDDVVPDQPLTVGPGYHPFPGPAASSNRI
ncbi:hypothetical protein E2A64_00055 [Pseudohoeflea suaedae]|uniref:Uncharacterized protein n=2 Tax=Pseudohoeflea suaedae TaxID=877384 RepID=A0A4R5PRU0_9HYPH|nr:hypothetical protein E2A64_00055 [Pseudohoeflea suaedae]